MKLTIDTDMCMGHGLCYYKAPDLISNRSTTGYLRKECLNRNHWTALLEAQVVIGDFKNEHNHRRHSALGYLTPAEYAARCRHTHHPVACEIN
jgi:transposase InsO family protein